MNHVDKIINMLNLKPHPEGGYFAETFVDSADFDNKRKIASVIYYLLKYDQYSHWHRVDATEHWFWHAGSPLSLTVSSNGHDANAVNLGPDILSGQNPQFTVEKYCWQTAVSLGEWSLVSCVVTPAFSFSGYELADDDWRPVSRQILPGN
jgi:predicted cupin superfamily sugar epimerase